MINNYKKQYFNTNPERNSGTYITATRMAGVQRTSFDDMTDIVKQS